MYGIMLTGLNNTLRQCQHLGTRQQKVTVTPHYAQHNVLENIDVSVFMFHRTAVSGSYLPSASALSKSKQ